MSLLFRRLYQVFSSLYTGWRLVYLNRQVAARARMTAAARPVVFFNASTRIADLSQNAAFALLTSWATRLAGVPVVHFVCRRGMSCCVQGTSQDDVYRPMPCRACLRQSMRVYHHATVRWFEFQRDEVLSGTLSDLSLVDLMAFAYPLNTIGENRLANSKVAPASIPLGQMVLPAIRWRLRVHNLRDDEPTRFLFREFILSAWCVAYEFNALLDELDPQVAVIFNGQFFPEAVAAWLCRSRGVRVITHEVGLQPFTAFFSPGEATAYPIDIPATFRLSPEQNVRLDAYLEKRFQGHFSMAGIRFWPEMRGLDDTFLQKARQFKQIVPVFTNVIFDTSQPHSNVVFSDMFAWLDLILDLIRSHPETLFVVRAHPDEMRPGSKKQSRESVRDWVHKNNVQRLPNVVFFDSEDYASSYELIQRAKFVMVYNSSIGVEASILGAAVLCGGKARFTQIQTVFFPPTSEAYRKQAETFLTADKIHVASEFQSNARRFLYYQLFFTSLPFAEFLGAGSRRGMVALRHFGLQKLSPQHSPTMKTLVAGIINGAPLLLEGQ